MHVVDAVIHDRSGHSFPGEAERPRRLHVQVEARCSAGLSSVVLSTKIQFTLTLQRQHYKSECWRVTYNVPLLRVEWVVWQRVGFCVVSMRSQLVTLLATDWITSNLFVASLLADVTYLLDCRSNLEIIQIQHFVNMNLIFARSTHQGVGVQRPRLVQTSFRTQWRNRIVAEVVFPLGIEHLSKDDVMKQYTYTLSTSQFCVRQLTGETNVNPFLFAT